MTGKPAKKFHGVGIGPLSKILAVKYFPGLKKKCLYCIVLLISELRKNIPMFFANPVVLGRRFLRIIRVQTLLLPT